MVILSLCDYFNGFNVLVIHFLPSVVAAIPLIKEDANTCDTFFVVNKYIFPSKCESLLLILYMNKTCIV